MANKQHCNYCDKTTNVQECGPVWLLELVAHHPMLSPRYSGAICSQCVTAIEDAALATMVVRSRGQRVA